MALLMSSHKSVDGQVEPPPAASEGPRYCIGEPLKPSCVKSGNKNQFRKLSRLCKYNESNFLMGFKHVKRKLLKKI